MSRQEDLEQLIALGEGYTLEFKRSGTSHLGRELCAFANASGGRLLIGVDDQGAIVGVADHNRLKSAVQSIARQIEPAVLIDIESVANVLVVTIPEQHNKPYSDSGRFYLREGANCQQLGRNEIRDFYFREGLLHYDEMPCHKFNMPLDLDRVPFESFAKRARIPEDIDHLQALENLRLVNNGQMTNAGAWLLAEDIRAFHSTAIVMCGLFMGTTKVKILDSKLLAYDPYRNHREAVNYILSKINTEFIIKAPTREERPELPEEALREAVANAVAHRDYRSNANIEVCIFHDRVEIVNPGGLPAGMKLRDLGVKSIPRNPLLFSMLHRMDVVEHIGSGIKRMRRICKEYGVEGPLFDVDENWFTITFPRPVKARTGESAQVEAQEAQVEAQEAQVDLAAWEIQLLISCQEEDATGKELLQAAGYTSRTGNFKRGLEKLIRLQLIERTIPDKPTSRLQKYRLTEKGRAWLQDRPG